MSALSPRPRRSRRVRPSDPDRAGHEEIEHKPLLVSYFRRRGADAATVEDLSQEVYRRFYDRLHRNGAGEIRDVKHYLRRAAGTVWIDHLRHKQRCNGASHVEFDDELHSTSTRIHEHGPEGGLAAHRLVAAIEALPERTRHVFIFFHLDAMSLKEIAEHFGIAVTTVQTHLHKARSRICQVLRETR